MTSIPAQRRSNYRQVSGVGLVFLATIAWSFSGLYTRLLTTDVMTAIAWRAFFGGGFLLLPFVARHRARSLAALSIGRPGFAMVVCIALCSASTVGAFYFTSIANAAVIYATAPFMAAGLAFWLVGERMQKRTTIASAVALLGVVIIVSSAFGSGHLFGDLLAVLMTLTFAFMIVIPRAYPEVHMLPTSIVGATATLLCFAPFGHAAAMSTSDWTVLAAFGFTNFTIALFLFLAGARRIAAAQAALIGTLDVVLAPLWVWIVFKERPSVATFAGGGLILCVVVWHTVIDWQIEARSANAGVAP